MNFDARPFDEYSSEFLSPEQRLEAVAEILAAIGLRAMKSAESDPLDESNFL